MQVPPLLTGRFACWTRRVYLFVFKLFEQVIANCLVHYLSQVGPNANGAQFGFKERADPRLTQSNASEPSLMRGLPRGGGDVGYITRYIQRVQHPPMGELGNRSDSTVYYLVRVMSDYLREVGHTDRKGCKRGSRTAAFHRTRFWGPYCGTYATTRYCELPSLPAVISSITRTTRSCWAGRLTGGSPSHEERRQSMPSCARSATQA